MVVPTGIEPVTLGLWVPRSNQLSYGTMLNDYILNFVKRQVLGIEAWVKNAERVARR